MRFSVSVTYQSDYQNNEFIKNYVLLRQYVTIIQHDDDGDDDDDDSLF